MLGYESQRTLNRDTNTAEAFREDFDPDNLIHPEKASLDEWQTADFLFQLTADEIRQHAQETITFSEDSGVDESIYQSYLFLAIRLKGNTYSRTALANITREINKCYAMPALLIFQHGHTLTFAIINRRPSQRDRDLDVLEKVTLIKDIAVANPHRAHIDILAELSLDAPLSAIWLYELSGAPSSVAKDVRPPPNSTDVFSKRLRIGISGQLTE